MATTITYKGSTITEVGSGVTKTLKTGGTWVEGDIIVNGETYINCYTGTGVPSASIGNNGDVYIQIGS